MSWRAIAFAPSDSATVYAGASACGATVPFDDRMPAHGFSVSYDGGATWSQANDAPSKDANLTSLAVAPYNPHVVYAATGYHGLLKSTDRRQSWAVINQGLPVGRQGLPGSPQALSVALHPADASFVYAGLGMAGLYRSTGLPVGRQAARRGNRRRRA